MTTKCSDEVVSHLKMVFHRRCLKGQVSCILASMGVTPGTVASNPEHIHRPLSTKHLVHLHVPLTTLVTRHRQLILVLKLFIHTLYCVQGHSIQLLHLQ